MRLYRFGQDAAMAETHAELQLLLQERFYSLEEAVATKVQDNVENARNLGQQKTLDEAAGEIGQDASVLREMALRAGVPAAEMGEELREFHVEVREQFEQLQSGFEKMGERIEKIDSMAIGIEEIKQLLASERPACSGMDLSSSAGPILQGAATADQMSQPTRPRAASSGCRQPIDSLNVEEVALLMHSLELAKYADAMRALPMTGAALAIASDDELCEAGVASGLHRKLLLKKVAEFSDRGVPIWLLLHKEQRAATRIQAVQRGNSGRLELRLTDFPSLPLEGYKLQRLFHQIDTSYPGVQLINESPYVFIVRDFLSTAECNTLIALVAKSNESGPSATSVNQKATRTSTTLIANSEELSWLRLRIASMLGVGVGHLEPTKLTRYAKGEFFTPHVDGVFSNRKLNWYRNMRFEATEGVSKELEDPCGVGAFPDRFMTVFMYLNDVAHGGRTTFTDVDRPTMLHGWPAELANLRSSAASEAQIAPRVDARSYFDRQPPPSTSSSISAAVTACLPPPPSPPPKQSHSSAAQRSQHQLTISPRAGMAVVHFPTTTSTSLCMPDLSTEHEGEVAISNKFIAQQFVWSTPLNEVAAFLSRAVAAGSRTDSQNSSLPTTREYHEMYTKMAAKVPSK